MEIKLSPTYSFSELGQKENQEDCIWPKESMSDYNCLILCDGMGGHEKGEVASRLVVEALHTKMKTFNTSFSAETAKKYLKVAMSEAYQELNNASSDSDCMRKMGTTTTCLIPCSDGFLAAHIGDSRIYQFRRGKGIVFRTRDHSVVAELVALGEMTEEEARTSPIRNQITKAIMPCQENFIEPTLNLLTDIRKGDIFFLCCDGVLEKVSEPELTEILTSKEELSQRIANLKTICAERKTRDNNSCIAIEVTDAKGESKSIYDKIKEVFS